MNWNGLIVGIGTFLLIGVFHILVIKREFYFGKESWLVFAGAGIVAVALSTVIQNETASALVAVFGITCLWSIKELFEQENTGQKRLVSEQPEQKAEAEKFRRFIRPQAAKERGRTAEELNRRLTFFRKSFVIKESRLRLGTFSAHKELVCGFFFARKSN